MRKVVRASGGPALDNARTAAIDMWAGRTYLPVIDICLPSYLCCAFGTAF